MAREEIIKLIEKSIKELQKAKKMPKFDIPEIKIEHPEEKIHGDYSTNIAMVIVKPVKKNPLEIAEIINNQLLIINKKLKLFKKIEIAKPGFINFFLSKEYLQRQVDEILKQGEKFGNLNLGKNKKVQVEFISANPTGPLHIGNGRGAFFGDTLANVLEKAGYKVMREYYINDAKNGNQIRELGKTFLGRGVTYLTDKLKTQILKLKTTTQSLKLTESEAGYLLAQEVQKNIKDFIGNKLKIKFDNWVSEEDLYKRNKIDKIFNWLKNKNLVYQKEGAWWIKTSEFGDSQDWVVIRSEAEGGEPTYLLSDIAYHQDKFDRGFQKIINIWGADHQGHVSKIKAAAKMLGYKGDLDILISQVVRLKRGKISKRKGQIITLEDLINEVGLDVARFLYLTKSLDTQMEFDLEIAKEQSEKNPVYYVQYAHARICSVLNSWGGLERDLLDADSGLLQEPRELALLKRLAEFPGTINTAARELSPHVIAYYLKELAADLHGLYVACQFLVADEALKQARLLLIAATRQVLNSGLALLGVSAPEKM